MNSGDGVTYGIPSPTAVTMDSDDGGKRAWPKLLDVLEFRIQEHNKALFVLAKRVVEMINKQTKEKARMGVGNDYTIDDQEQAVATDELDLDSVNFMVDGSHIGVNEVGSKLVGNLKAPEDPTREKPHQTYMQKENVRLFKIFKGFCI
ncbi:hypothetical protein L1987_18068 [Smallanthus sonchifolius]|uniref:Uncharacterized protein n=1 Tax=Smallanthus sonchifolius TaxID=185202 RepID=A0ACB9IZS7_9ASTR|nr:hypothetical protein L1987_18068 [Smallanthus sonchifolius]